MNFYRHAVITAVVSVLVCFGAVACSSLDESSNQSSAGGVAGSAGTGASGGAGGGGGAFGGAAGAGGVAPDGGGGTSTGGTAGSRGGSGGTGGGGATGGSGGATGGSGGATGGSGGSTGGSGGAAYNPCPPSGQPCKILPLGDSITEGLGSTHSGAYRVDLFHRALGASKRITFVGSRRAGPSMVDGTTFPRNHEGYSGYTIDQIAGMIPRIVDADPPHIILLMIGTNDMYRMGAAEAPRRLETLLDKLLAAIPDGLLVAAQIIPLPRNTNVEAYNAAIPALVQKRAAEGKHIVLVDQFTGFPNSELADGVHPNDVGYRRMAGVWYGAIDDFLR